jgi:hypothetical protein
MSFQNSSFYQRPTEVVAKDLVGKKLVRTIRNNKKQFRLAGLEGPTCISPTATTFA